MENQLKLFPGLEQSQTRCKYCAFCERLKCGSKNIFYCRKRKSNRTDNGLLKIKANKASCCFFAWYVSARAHEAIMGSQYAWYHTRWTTRNCQNYCADFLRARAGRLQPSPAAGNRSIRGTNFLAGTCLDDIDGSGYFA